MELNCLLQHILDYIAKERLDISELSCFDEIEYRLIKLTGMQEILKFIEDLILDEI